jgi:hypothetical protein
MAFDPKAYLARKALGVDGIIADASEAYGVPVPIIRGVIGQESAGNPRAVSPKGAQGYMQLMPDTAADLGVTDPFDAQQNIHAGTRYLRQMYDQFGDWQSALTAYNGGPANFQKYGGPIPGNKENTEYAPAVLARAQQFAQATFDPKAYLASKSAPASPLAAPQAAPAQPADDSTAEADFLKFRAANPDVPESRNREALQYKMIHPELSLGTIVNQLPELRARAAADKINWQDVAKNHPVLMDYIKRDPATMHLALGQASTLQGIQKFLGGAVEQVARGAYYGTQEASAGFGEAVMAALAWGEEHALGREASIITGDPFRRAESYFRQGKEFTAANARADTVGDALKNAGKIRRAISDATDTLFNATPYAIEATGVHLATGGSYSAMVLFNSIMNIGNVFSFAKAKGMSEGQALLATAGGAPAVGLAMSAGPLSRMADGFTTAATKAAFQRIFAGEAPSLARMAWTTLVRGTMDAASGQIALGLQRAATQAAVTTNLKDAKEIPLEFLRGTFTDPSFLGFHALGFLGAVGRLTRSASDAQKLHSLVSALTEAPSDPASAAMRVDASGKVAAQPQADRAVYYPVDQFLSEAERLGKDPRQLAVDLLDDKGAAYDVALATRAEHIKIPADRLEHFVRGGLGDSLRQYGKFDQNNFHQRELDEQVDDLRKVFDGEYRNVSKLDPDKLSPQDAELYRMARTLTDVVADKDGTALPRMIATVRALNRLHPDMTQREVFDALFGKQGVYGQEARQQTPQPVTSDIEPSWIPNAKDERGNPAMQIVYRHSELPMKLHLEPDVVDGKKVWTAESFNFDRKIVGETTSETDLAEQYGGKGRATQVYLKALKDAKDAGVGWQSDLAISRTKATENMYARLKKLGFNFVEREGRHYISPEDLQKVDFSQSQMTGEVHAVPRLIEMVKNMIGQNDPRWFNGFKEEEARTDARAAETKADDAASSALKEALINNDRRFMKEARDVAVEKAKQQVAENPLVKLARAVRNGFEGLDKDQVGALTREDGKPYRLLASEVAQVVGPDGAAQIGKLYPKLLTSDPQKAMDARDMAMILGYQHSETGLAEKHLLMDLFNTPDEKAMVKELAQQELDRRFGPDLTSNPQALVGAALDAMHTPAATDRLLKLYRSFAEVLDPVTKARSAMTSEMWHAHAERLLGAKALEEIDPHYFALAEGRAVRDALEVGDGSQGDNGERRAQAARKAESALLYHHLYLAAREASDTLGAAHAKLERSAASDLHVQRLGFADPVAGEDGLNAYQRAREGALAAVGLMSPRPGADYSGAAQALIDRAQELGHYGYLADGALWHPDAIQKIIDNRSGWGALTPDEARQLHAFITNIENAGKKLSEAGRDGLTPKDRADRIAQWLTNGGIREPKNPLELDPNMKRIEDGKGVKGLLKAVIEPFTWLPRALGMTNTPGNWNAEALLRRLGPEGIRLVDELRESITERHQIMQELYEPWKKIYDRTMQDPKVMTEAVGAADRLKAGDLGMADRQRVTYGWLMNLARWYGDADGRQRVLKLFKLIPDNVEKTLAKYLTPEQLANIQAEKDHVDQTWYPRLAQKQLERTGLPLRRSMPAAFTINGVEYRGGHVTLSYDDRAGMGLDPRRPLADSSLGSFNHDAVGFFRATMEGGFLQERSGAPTGAKPDLGSLTAPQTMADMAHHLAVGDFLLTANQTLLHPNTVGVIEKYVGEGSTKALQGWLMRTASDLRGGPERIDPGARESAEGMRYLRSSLMLAAVAGKITIPLAHLTHPFMVGWKLHDPLYAARYTLPAFTDLMNSMPNWLATGTNEFIERAQAESAYLRQRSADAPEDIANLYFERSLKQAGALKGGWMKAREGIENVGSVPLRQMDAMFSSVIYEARKTHALENGASPEQAIKLAEEEVMRSMPNFATHMRSGFAASKNGFQSMITPFMGYYATVRDLYRSRAFEKIDAALREREAATGKEAPPWYRTGKQMQWYAALAIPVLLGLGMGTYLKGSGSKDNEEQPAWKSLDAGYWQREYGHAATSALTDGAWAAALHMAELQPFASHFGEQVKESIMTGKKGDFAPGTILLSPFDSVGKAISKTTSPRFSAGDAALEWGRALSPAFGLPTAPVANIGGVAMNYEDFLRDMPTSPAAQAINVVDHLVYPHYWGRAAKYQPSNPLRDLKDAVQYAADTDKGPARRMPW